MRKYTVIEGNVPELAKKIAEKLNAKLIKTQTRIFPDGESKVTLSENPGKYCIVVYSTFPPVDSNLIKILSVISKAKEHAQEVTAIIPYMGYARQDREFLPGEVVTMKVLNKLFRGVGTSKIIVVDIHSKIGLKQFTMKKENISAIPDLVKYFQKIKLKNPLVVSPDKGGEQRAKMFAASFGSDYIALTKNRDRKTGKVKIITSKLAVQNRDLILVDDMISTGGSIIKATEFLKKQKCRRVFVACTHALLMNNAETRIKKAGVTKIVSANTIPGKTSIVDVSDAIIDAIIDARKFFSPN